MKKISQYLKPYGIFIIATIVFLLCQSIVDLNLPNLMSDIVNVGIQQNGIDDLAPKVISKDSYQSLSILIGEDDKAYLDEHYILIDDANLSKHQYQNLVKTYPGIESHTTYILNSHKADERLENIFKDTDYALKTLLAKIDLSNPSKFKDELIKNPDAFKEALKSVESQSDNVLEQNAHFFTKLFYQELDVNLATIQNTYILKVGVKMLVATLLLVGFAIAVGYSTSKLGTGVAKDLRRDLFTKVSHFSSKEFEQFGTASLITRCTNDVVQVRSLLSMGLRTICYAPIIGIGGIIMALYKSPNMTWIIALAAIIIFMLVFVMFVVAMPKFKIMQKLVDKLNLVSRENLSGMMVVRAFANQEFEEARFDKANRDLADNNLFVYRAMAFMMPTMMFVMNGISILIVWFGGHQIASSSIQVGDMMAFIQYTMQIIMSFLMISMVFVVVPRALVSANRIAEVLDIEIDVKNREKTLPLNKVTKGKIEFKDVAFSYDQADEKVLDKISFVAKPGETTAFIGSTGSGKSTLVNLIPRFFDVTEGSIKIDDIDIRDYSLEDLRSLVAYIPQKGMLFSGDIESNLRYGDNTANESKLQNALDIAQASEFVNRLDDGIKTEISQGGTNVSGGQRQRLSIARALVKDAKIYIFDDTFSALDFKTDAKLRKAINDNMHDVTTLIVAQRVSTIMNADQIVVLDNGQIVGLGKHEDLLKNCKTYREIAESQLSKEELN